MSESFDNKKFDGIAFQREFFDERQELFHLTQLLEHVPGAYFFVKDRKSRFVRMNPLNLELYGLSDERAILGKSDRDFHPPALAEAYIAEDQRVIELKQPIVDQTWLVPYLDGRQQWFISTKIPLVDASGSSVGLAGVMHAVSTPEEHLDRFKCIAPAVQYLEEHFSEPIAITEIAEMTGLSLTHFNRMFSEMLQMTPTQYRTALRVNHARFLLKTTRESITDIATDTGFCDQSHFTKQFKKSTGLTPGQYRSALSSRGKYF